MGNCYSKFYWNIGERKMNYKKFSFDFKKILSLDIMEFNNKTKRNKIYHIIKSFIGGVITKDRFIDFDKKNIDKGKNIFIKCQNRNDYNELFDKIFDQCYFDKNKYDYERKITFNFIFLIDFFRNKDIMVDFCHEFSRIDAVFYYIRFIRYAQVVYCLKNIKIYNLIAFSDVQPYENVIIQYCNFNNITTATMQHGLYIDYKNLPNINMLNYIDVSSKYLLAWGESTKELFGKYNSNIKVEICGKPIEINNNTTEIDIKLIGIVFDQPMFSEYNKKLLSVAVEFADKHEYEIVVRIHPSDNPDEYSINSNKIRWDSNLLNTHFILAHTTSMICEYMQQKKRIYILKSNIPSNEYNSKIKFNSCDELEKIIDFEFDFINEAEKHIAFTGSNSLNKYKEFFNKIN